MSTNIGNNLEITEIRIWPTRDAQMPRLKAMVSLTFNGTLRVNGCRIIEGAKGLFLSYPAQKRVGSDYWDSLFHPVDRDTSNAIQETVLKQYRELVPE